MDGNNHLGTHLVKEY